MAVFSILTLASVKANVSADLKHETMVDQQEIQRHQILSRVTERGKSKIEATLKGFIPT